jgi:hypothetical protein
MMLPVDLGLLLVAAVTLLQSAHRRYRDSFHTFYSQMDTALSESAGQALESVASA